MTGKLQLERITDGLTTRRVGRRIEVHETVVSTNEVAWTQVAEQSAGDGLVVFAEYQSAGRGRLGRSWGSPRGASVLMSLVLVDLEGEIGGDALALLAAVAAVDAVDTATTMTPEIKWPNDLMINGRKLGGILVECHRAPSPTLSRAGARQQDGPPSVYVVGIGINCLQHRNHFPPELRASATSLDLESPHPVDRTEVARNLLIELDRWLAEPSRWDARVLRDEWVRRALPLGRRIRLRQVGEEFSGHVVDVDPAAGLVVQLDRGGRRLFDAASTSVVD